MAALGRDSYFKRFRIRVSDADLTEGEFEVTTLCEPVVRMIRRYRVGEAGPIFGILSFRGVPVEMGYETQVPVFLSPRRANAPPIVVEWIRWE